jgi:MFS family permease
MTIAIPLLTARPERAPKLALAAAATAVGDWLFYGHAVGISVALFLVVLAAGVVAGNVVQARGRTRVLAIGFLVAGLLPLLKSVDALSCLIAVTGLALFTTLVINGAAPSSCVMLGSALRLIAIGPLRLLTDLYCRLRGGSDRGSWRVLNAHVSWTVPVALCGVFAFLFASANPLIEVWVSGLEWSTLIKNIDINRLLVWTLLLSLTWAFIAVRPRAASSLSSGLPQVVTPEPSEALGPSPFLDEATIRRSLILFNLLFSVQTVLDLTYLWGGVKLPDGMSYAAYAHRGAYPLIFTALLAGGFVLVAMAPGSAGERSPAIRSLVFLWIGQNVLLVVSSMLRLDLYVATYSLTVTRLAAFAWMGLVGVGLVLIVARIKMKRSNAWLLGANGLGLASVLYIFALVNVPALVSDYNVAHSSDLGTGEQPFDVRYAMSLGSQAIPAVDRYLTARPRAFAEDVLRWRDTMASQEAAAMAGWRGWTLTGWRLSRYLKQRS